MQTCPAEDVLQSFCERSLPAETFEAVSAHLGGCADCRAIVAELARSFSGGGELPVDAPARALIRGSSLGRYLVLEQVGQGGMGVVYSAYDPDLDRRVAVKLLRKTGEEKQRARLVQEARAMAKLSHPNVAAVYGVETLDERVFVTMEFIVGETVRHWLENERSVNEVLDVFLQAGRGLEAAHDAGIVHRDFKPDNMMVRPDGRVAVLDFGLARPTGTGVSSGPVAEPSSTSLTETGTVMGTLRYMPPEQRLGQPTDARADQFAFCVSLHEALYGAPPGEPAKRTPSLTGRLTRALERGRSESPNDRFPDMRALLVELEGARAPAKRWGWAAGATLVLGVTAGLLVWPQLKGPCTTSAAEAAQAWSPERRAALEGAFAAQSLAPGEVTAALDAYAGRWAGAHQQACEATRVHGVQSEELLDRRMLCLDARKAALRATATLLEVSSRSLVRAPIAVAALPQIDDCADARWLLEAVPPPADAASRERLSQVREQLARARATREIARIDEALAMSKAVATAAEGVGYLPLLAEAVALRTELLRSSGEAQASEESAWSGVRAALGSRDARLQAQAWLLLAEVMGVIRRRPLEAEQLFAVAKAAIAAVPEARLLAAHWLRAFGQWRETVGDAPGAIASYEQAIAHFEKLPDGPRGVMPRLLRRIADTQTGAGDFDAAIAAARKAVTLSEADSTGASQLDVSLHSLSDALAGKGLLDEARTVARRGLVAAGKGGNRFSIAVGLASLAEIEQAAGNLDAAADALMKMVAAVEQLPAPNPYLAEGLGQLGGVQLLQKDYANAERSLKKSLALFEGAGMKGDDATLHVRVHLAQTYFLTGARAEARQALADTLPVLDAKGIDPSQVAKWRFAAAQLTWDLENDHAKAVAMAKAAREASPAAAQAPIDAWLASHR